MNIAGSFYNETTFRMSSNYFLNYKGHQFLSKPSIINLNEESFWLINTAAVFKYRKWRSFLLRLIQMRELKIIINTHDDRLQKRKTVISDIVDEKIVSNNSD